MEKLFLLVVAAFFILLPLMPSPLGRGKSGIPHKNQAVARVACAPIGVALLLLWYSLPPK
jgi:hypothetical protein